MALIQTGSIWKLAGYLRKRTLKGPIVEHVNLLLKHRHLHDELNVRIRDAHHITDQVY